MTRARTFQGFGLGIAAALFAASALALATPAHASKKDDTLRFASFEILGNVDGYYNTQRTGVILADQIWDTLIYRDPVTGEYKGNLATAWRWIDDKTLELDLRQGVKFHDGASFDADDVIYTFDFASKPENKAVSIDYIRWIARVEKLSPHKIRIVAKQPFPAALAYLSTSKAAIYPHAYYAKVGTKGMNAHPVGSGPYRVVDHALGKIIRLERNPGYFKDSPKPQAKISKVEIRFLPDPQTRVAEMLAGGLDLIMSVARDQAEQLRDIPNLQIVSGETMRYSFLALTTTEKTPVPQLRDIRVRQAIMYAIDRETMVKYLIGNGSRVLHVECYPSQFGCDDKDVKRYAYDPGKARALLAEAGYAKGFDIDIYAYRDRNQTEAIIGYLAAVGIRARLRFLQAGAIVSARRAGKVALQHNDWGSSSIDDAVASVSNFHEFAPDDMNRDPEIRDLLRRADSSMDVAARKAAYGKALALIQERAYTLPLYSMPTYYLAAKDLVFKAYSDEIPRFYEMSWK